MGIALIASIESFEMKIREKQHGYVVEVDKANLDKTVTTGWAIWEFNEAEA